MAFEQKIKALEAFLANEEQQVLDLVRDDETLVLDLNRDQQLFDEGKDSTGKDIRPRYTPFTVAIKRSKGQPTDRVTLKDTGRFHASFRIIYGSDNFELIALDSKTNRLKAKYGDKILGITDPNLQTLIDIFKPELIQKLRKLLDV